HEPGRVAKLLAPQLRRSLGRLELAEIEQLQRAHDALPIVGGDAVRRPWGALGETRVKARSAVLLELRGPALAHSLRRCRAQVKLAERRAQVEARAADDQRTPAGREQAVDLGVGELRVLADAEGCVEREKREEPMLERRPLARRRDTREDLEARIHLQRVRRHGDRILAACAQELRERDGDRGLADACRPEQREDLHADRLTARADLWLHGAAHRRDGRHRTRDRPCPGRTRRQPDPDRTPRGPAVTRPARGGDVLEPLAAELTGRALAVDLCVPAEVDRLARQAGEVDILVANAALPASGTLDSFSLDEIDRALDVNLRAPIVLAHALAPGMVKRGRGHLLFMSSLAGKAATPG